tara:strand:+ start:4236 stop:6491 length:2256 start_codon:yes stop_codon:yes gene_type:complete
MSDTNLDPSISALSTRATEVAASASARELLNLSRIAPSLEQSENAGLEVAINSRAAGLAPSATATELKSIGKAIGNVLEPDTFVAGAFIPAQLDQSGKFLGTSGTSKNWSGVSVSGLSEVNISSIANDETLVYNHVSSQFENSSQVFNIPQYAQTADLPASATSGATAFDASTAELKYWDGSEWKVAAVVAAGGAPTSSIDFGGTSYIYTSDYSGIQFNTGDFTAECWVKLNSLPSGGSPISGIFGKRTSAGGYWRVAVHTDGTISYQTDENGSSAKISSAAVSLNSWHHVAISRSSGTVTIYLDGVAQDSRADTDNLDYAGQGISIGALEGTFILDGYISDVRLIKGTSVYTQNFSVPTAALADVAGTSLLISSSNTTDIVDASSFNQTIYWGGPGVNASLVTDSPYPAPSGGGSGSVVFSPAYQSEDTYSAGTHTFNVSGEYIITPSADVTATVKMWGAGGGGGYRHDGSNLGVSPQYGGPGGYSEMSLTLTSGQEYVIQIGEGGRGYNNDDNVDQGATWQAGGGGDEFAAPNQGASEGGGYTGLFLGNGGGDTAVTQGQAILIAGGGGSGGDPVYGSHGGAGGGDIGQDSVTGNFNGGHDMQGATGGDQSSAGSSSPYNGNNTSHAGPLRGGLSQSGNQTADWAITTGLGGGGGGYFGGGGGNVGGGGGGSGYVNDTYGTGITTSISAGLGLNHNGLPPYDDDSDYPTDAGKGGYGLGTSYRPAGATNSTSADDGYNGYDGAVVIIIS